LFEFDLHNLFFFWSSVTTLTSGSQPRQGLTRVRVKKEAWESHFMLPIV
jgi:hypothetical protein